MTVNQLGAGKVVTINAQLSNATDTANPLLGLAKAGPGTIRRDQATQQVDFVVSDGVKEYPVTYRGIVPDTFTDANDIEVIVEGRLGRDGVFHATEVFAKCGSRYEAELDKAAKA